MNASTRVLALVALAGILSNANAIAVFGPPTCPDTYGVHAYPHPEDCARFFLCTNGTLTLEQCENGLLFDGHGNIHNHCNYNWAVDCGERKADLTPLSSEGCLYQFGVYAESTACSTNYIKCVHGEPLLEACTPGLAWDDKSHSCVWPDQLDNCDSEAIVGFKCPSRAPKGTAAAKFWPFPRFPVPGDCGRLITCVDYHPRLITCGDGKLFDSITLSCMDPDDHPQCANGL